MYRWGLSAYSPPPPAILPVLQNASQSSGVPLNILQSVAYSESRYNPSAVSPKGAQGLLQIMPATGKSLGLQDPFDPQQNADVGAAYLKSLYDKYGDWNTALVAYNEGPGNFAKSGAFPSSQSYADTILQNAGQIPPSVDTFGASAFDPTASGGAVLDGSLPVSAGIDLSSISPVWWGVGLAALGLGLMWRRN
jgi:soluble lytic murein transglycosylase-like protein